MKQEFYFHIPQPCHEDWDKMTTAAKGRFCESCSKNVVDFSLMTDNEVLNYFKNNSGKVCGRFANDQLQRPFIPLGEQKKKTWWVAMMMPFMLFSKQDSKSKNVIKQNVITLDTIPSQHILGKISAPNFHETKIDTIQCTGVTLGAPAIILPDTAEIIGDVDILEDTIRMIGDTTFKAVEAEEEKGYVIKGKITDEKDGKPISFVTVALKDKNIATAADINGYFSLAIPSEERDIVLTLSAVGYEVKEIPLLPGNKLSQIIVPNESFKMREASMGELVVTVGYTIKHAKVKRADTLSMAIRKIFKTGFFKTYPNPAQRGSVVHLEIKKAGDYSIQLFDNNSNLILVQAFSAANDNSITNISIPSSLAAGIYYLRLIDEKKKKQFTDKIIVE